MSYHGRFCWYELTTSDPDAAQAFYGSVLGWIATSFGNPHLDYRLLGPGDSHVAGVMPVPDPMRAPRWTGFVGVDDADATSAQAKAGGATIHVEPTDLPGVGRFAVFSDPQGVPLSIITPGPNPPTPPADMYDAIGRIGWHELDATDADAAWRFHANLFGWTKSEASEMGAPGVYQLFRPATLDRDVGALTAIPDRPSAWTYYFNVEGIAAVVARVREAGGAVTMGPHRVPGGSWIASCVDPQGAAFALSARGC